MIGIKTKFAGRELILRKTISWSFENWLPGDSSEKEVNNLVEVEKF